MKLREYQKEAFEKILEEWDKGIDKTLVVMATGTGKTILLSKVTESMVKAGKRVLILAHRAELLEQAADKLYRSTGLRCGVEKAEKTSENSFYRVTVGSIQSMASRKRLERISPDDYDVIIVDEAHHALSDTYQRVLNHFSKAKVLGVTATPDRGDYKNLGAFFESIAYSYDIAHAIKDGFLSPIKALTIPLEIDLNDVKISGGDFSSSDIASVLDPYLFSIADEMKRYASDRKTVVFLPLVETSKKFTKILNSKGFKAIEVNGNSKDRQDKIKAFDEGRYNVICNSMLLTEGWDCPSVDCVIVLRPTKSRSLYTQMVGRGSRLYPGKEDLLLLDFLWNSEKHKLIYPAHLIASSEKIASKMTELAKEKNEAMDIGELEKQACNTLLEEREEALADKLKEMRRRKRKLVDPLQFEMSIRAEDLSDYVPGFGWEMGKPTEKQIKALENYGIYPDEIDSRGKASLILERLEKRKDLGLSTPKQIRQLEARGFVRVGEWSKEDASKMISRIAMNHWKTPRNIDVKTYRP